MNFVCKHFDELTTTELYEISQNLLRGAKRLNILKIVCEKHCPCKRDSVFFWAVKDRPKIKRLRSAGDSFSVGRFS